MNLNTAPTKAQLRELIGQRDDRAGHHVLWVDRAGAVHVSMVSTEESALNFGEAHPDAQIRFETFQRGKEYVGSAAAQDDEWISWLFNALLKDWSQANGNGRVEYVELP
jgi:hypothetical protein